MADEYRVITCPDCSAKYKVPATFAGKKVKCKKCDSTIDVDGGAPAAKPARPAAKPSAKPAPPKAAAAGGSGKPSIEERRKARAAARGEAEGQEGSEEKAARAGRRTARGAAAAGGGARSRRRGAEAASEGEEGASARGARGARSRRGAPAAAEKKGNPVLIYAGAGVLVVILAIVGFLLFGGNGEDEPTKTDAVAAKTEGNATSEAPAGESDNTGAPQGGEAQSDASAKTAAASPPEPQNTGPWSPRQEENIEDPVIQFEPVPYLDGTPEDTKKKIDDLAALAADPSGGAESRGALSELRNFGRDAVPGLTNAFVGLDMSNDQHRIVGRLISQTLYDIYLKGWDQWLVEADPKFAPPETFNQKIAANWASLWIKEGRNDGFWFAVEEKRKAIEERDKADAGNGAGDDRGD